MDRASTDRQGGSVGDPVVGVPPQLSNFAEVMRRQSEASLRSASRLVEALGEAKSLEDVIAVQSKFIIKSAEDYANLARQLGDLLVVVPMLTASSSSDQENDDTKTPLARHFEALVGEAISGMTEPVTGLSRNERRKALFDTER